MSCSQHGLFTKKKKKGARGIFFELKTHARILPTLTADVKKRHCKHCSFCPCFHRPRKKKKKKDTFREEWSVGKLGEAGGRLADRRGLRGSCNLTGASGPSA